MLKQHVTVTIWPSRDAIWTGFTRTVTRMNMEPICWNTIRLLESSAGRGWSLKLQKHVYKLIVFKNRFFSFNHRSKITFLSVDFVAKTDMWQASSGYQKGAVVFPSSSPHNQPGEFSSPEIEKKKRFFSIHSYLGHPNLMFSLCTYFISFQHASHSHSSANL